jgi:hypothetical protein
VKIQGELRRFERSHFVGKLVLRLRSKRRSSPCILQVVACIPINTRLSLNIRDIYIQKMFLSGICTGPKREFFVNICKDIVGEQHQLFHLTDDNQYRYHTTTYIASYKLVFHFNRTPSHVPKATKRRCSLTLNITIIFGHECKS